MARHFIAPAALIFLCGVGVGFSLFPHVFVVRAPTQPNNLQEISTLPDAVMETATANDAPALDIPPLPRQAPVTSVDQENSVLQLFSPTSTEVDAMQSESEQMKLLEQTMMLSYLLSNCGIMKQPEYELTYEALIKYLTNYGDPEPNATARSAAKRAEASYKMVYRNIPCDDPSLFQMAASLREWRQSVVPDPAPKLRR